MAILEINGAKKYFGGVKAVDDISLELKSSEIAGLVGSNGAGKTTLFNLISGFLPLDSGEIIFNGEKIDDLSPYKIIRKGVARTFQITRTLSRMSVMENMLLGPKNQTGESWWRRFLQVKDVREEEKNHEEKAKSILEFFELSEMRDEYAGALSGGQKKLLELARALMTDPDLILLDEPFAGVNPTLENKLIDYLQELRSDGLTFLLIEHDMPLIDELSDHLFVMNEGRIIARGNLDDIKENEKVQKTYLGEEV